MSLREILLIVIATIAIPAWAETQCIRQGNEEIILFDDARKYCPPQIGPVDPKLGWKFAFSDDRPGCWRADDYFVYVALEAKPSSLLLPGDIEPLSACKKFNDQQAEKTREYMSDACEDFDLDSEVAVVFCRKALAMAESYGESDPRLWRAIDILAARTDDLVESEKLIERSKAIRQKYAPSDYEALMGNLVGIARIQQRRGQFDAAGASFQEAIRLGRQHLGEDHLDVVAWTLLLGKMYFDLGKYPQAEEQLLVALAGAVRDRPIYWKMGHKIAATTARLLADICQKEGKSSDADRYREIARRHREAAQQPGLEPSDDPDLS